ncbi:MAG: hypothetical protein KAF27_01685, partial [Porphyrobacter sp.]|nr:hypothetical protein [Porphyrobacter sp.]
MASGESPADMTLSAIISALLTARHSPLTTRHSSLATRHSSLNCASIRASVARVVSPWASS